MQFYRLDDAKVSGRLPQNHQEQAILKIIRDAGGILESEQLRELLSKAKEDGLLRTKHDPWLIFKFHSRSMINTGVLVIITDPLEVIHRLIEKEERP